MAQTPSPSPSARHNGNRKSNYTFYDEDYKPMWKRGISRKIGGAYGYLKDILLLILFY